MVSENKNLPYIQEAWEVVLILVLVEDGLGGYDVLTFKTSAGRVLILVLVEDGLGEVIDSVAAVRNYTES